MIMAVELTVSETIDVKSHKGQDTMKQTITR